MRVHRNMLAKISSVLLLAGGFVVMNAARADAALILYVCDDADCDGAGSDFTIADDSALDMQRHRWFYLLQSPEEGLYRPAAIRIRDRQRSLSLT